LKGPGLASFLKGAAQRPLSSLVGGAMLIALCQSDTALAQRTQQNAESPAFKRCMAASGGVTSDMRACLHSEYDRLDKELNITYRSVMKQLKTKQLKVRLVEVQRVWIWRRDFDCQSKVDSSGAKGGTAGDLIYDDCLVTTVRQRIAWLKKVPTNPRYLTKV
jgi:uncharacterized protein YecT (DUF1311 family)